MTCSSSDLLIQKAAWRARAAELEALRSDLHQAVAATALDVVEANAALTTPIRRKEVLAALPAAAGGKVA